MKRRIFFSFFLFGVFIFLEDIECSKVERSENYPGCAIVTLAYQRYPKDYEYIQGAETLAYSLREVNSAIPKIALVTEQVSNWNRKRLERAGWGLYPINAVENVLPQKQARLKYIFSKLSIFGMTNYSKIIYLDSDTLVMDDIDHLCQCPGEYAFVMRNMWFNAGMLVVTPSKSRYDYFMSEYSQSALYTYGGGDQSLLNYLLWNPQHCPFVDFQGGYALTDYPNAKCYRLGFEYNADVTVSIAQNNEWMFDPAHERTIPIIIHYTVGFMKPWVWWTYLIVPQQWHWWQIYEKYNEDADERLANVTILALPLFMACIYLIYCSFDLFKAQREGDGTWVGPLADSSSIVKVFVGQTLNGLCAFLGFAYSSMLPMSSPYANMCIAIVAYWVLFEYLCIQAFHHLFCAAENKSLPSTVVPYRILVFFAADLLLVFMMSGSVSVLTLGIVVFVWLIVFFGIAHTVYILSNYPTDSPFIVLNKIK